MKRALPKRIQDILDDGLAFISRLKIVNKEGKLVPLRPNAEQLKMFELLETGEDAVFGKPRQIGSSTFMSAYLFWKWLTATDPVNIAILSKDWDSTLHIFGMWRTFYENLPVPLRFKLDKCNQTIMRIAGTQATVRAISSKKPGALRSYTQTFVHLSELAFTDNPEEVLSTAYAALNGNQLIVESTANFYNDAVHQLIMKAERGEAALNHTFFSWTEHEEYTSDVPDSFTMTKHETSLGYTPGQIAWRRLQIQKHGLIKFQREYPTSVEEAYAQTGNSYFTPDDLEKLTIMRVEPKPKIYLAAPEKGESYAIGCDVASGRGGDYSTILALSKASYQPVALFKSNTISPEMFARVIQEYSAKYNDAKVLVESNNWGLPVLNELRNLGFTNLWKDDKGRDWETNSKTKLLMFEELRQALREGVIHQLDNITLGELRSYVLDSKGLAPHVPPNLPHHGDLPIALALAYQCLKTVRQNTRHLPDWIHQQRAAAIKKNGPGMGRRY